MDSPGRAEFHGVGISQTGSGNFNVQGDINIGSEKNTLKYEEILRKLRTTNPQDDKIRIEQQKGGLLYGSSRWILSHDDFCKWREDSESLMLWIKGDPGKGKTMLLCSIIDELVKDNSEECNVVYFFCQATDTRLDNAEAVLRSLLYGLRKQEPLKKRLLAEYKDAGDQLFEDANNWAAMSRILLSTLGDPDLPRTYLIIDALDECNNGLDNLLGLITQISSCRAKVLVSSRNWPEIEDGLGATAGKVILRLEMNSEAVSSAVRTYIDHKVGELANSKRYTAEQQEKVRQHLVSNANDTFLWVALVVKEFSNIKSRQWRTTKTLMSFPPGLDALYHRMARQVFASDDAELCRQVLSVISLVYQPIRLEEVCSLIENPSLFPDDNDSLREIIELCGSFLTLKGGFIYFVHQSAKEFLTGTWSEETFPLGVGNQHLIIARQSLQTMSLKLDHNMYEVQPPMAPIEEFCVPEPDPLLPIRYACLYWADHFMNDAKAPEVRDIEDDGLIHTFLKKHFLHWLEAMSLLRNIWPATLSMMRISSAAERGSTRSGLADLLHDAQRFIRRHIKLIELHPLQVYGSALVFSPKRSIVRQMFANKELSWLSTKPSIGQDWDAHLLTLAHPMNLVAPLSSIAFHPDERHLLSYTSDGKVRVWDFLTGQCQSTLQTLGDPHITRVCYPDLLVSWSLFQSSMRVAASTSSGKIWILDLTTRQRWESGTLAAPLDTSSEGLPPLSIALSPEGKQVAVVNYHCTIQMLDVEGGPCLMELEALDLVTDATSVAFSPDGRWFAVAGLQWLQIWDRKTHQHHWTWSLPVDHLLNFCPSLAFSPSQIGLGSDDGDIRIWDIETGKYSQTLIGDKAGIASICFSHDGSQVVSAPANYPICIWDLASGRRRSMPRHTDSIAATVVFSPDGRHIASRCGGLSPNVTIWDITLVQDERSNFSSALPTALAIAISPDEERVASGSGDGSLRVWSAATGHCEHTLRGHKVLITLVSFSPRGENIASASADGTIRVWNATTGQCQNILRPHHSPATSIAFSPSCDWQLASVSERDVCLSNISTNQDEWHCSRYSTYGRPINSLAFSPDGSQIVLGYRSGMVYVLDAASGCHRWKHKVHEMSKVDFYPDGSLIMVSTVLHGIHLLDAATGRDLAYFKDPGLGRWTKPTALSDSPDGIQRISRRIQTRSGLAAFHFLIPDGGQSLTHDEDDPDCPEYTLLGIGIDEDQNILKNGRPVLQIPPEHRWVPALDIQKAAVVGNTLAVGLAAGDILIFRMRPLSKFMVSLE